MANKHEIDIQSLALNMLDGDISAKTKIIEYYSNYIIKSVETRFNDCDCDKNILIESGKNGLFTAINGYKKGHKKYFSNYATSHIFSYIKHEIIKEKNRQENRYKHIQILANKMVNGDIESQNKIIEFYSYHIKKVIENEYHNFKYDKDDLYQAGIIGLLNAIKFYITKQNHAFAIYANTYIHREIEKEVKRNNQVPIIDYAKFNNNYNDLISDIEDKEAVKLAIQKLSQIQKEILYLYFYKNYSFIDIGNLYNFSHQNAHRHYKNAIKLIKNEVINNTCIKVKSK